ncbi:MAG: hypothetical protein IT462_07960 [Planctomycetes bacterium]|nr:hypothetical protein [Planctomycetota bacterium]
MSDPKKGGKKGGKGGVLLLALLLLVGGVGALGYFKPDTPFIGPFIAGIVKTGNQATSGAGSYEVTISELRFADAEFGAGDEVDLQVTIFAIGTDGKRNDKPVINTQDWGTNIGKAGDKEKPIAANWANKPLTIDWKPGESFLIEVWDRKGGDKKLAEWTSLSDAKGFPLSGTVPFTQVDGHPAKDKDGNFIKFGAKPTGTK